MTTLEIDQFAAELIEARGGRSADLGYHGYPANICVSVNDEVVHGIPSSRKIKEGDIVSVDVTVIKDGFHGDSGYSLIVDEDQASDEVKRLVRVTEESLYLGIRQACTGNRVGDISHAIQSHVEGQGYSLIREFIGHGIGRSMHEEPAVPNYGDPGKGPRLREGMVIAIEPMVAMGKPEIRILEDGWTVVTKDGSPSAYFEHTVAITSKGPIILTQR